MNTLFSDYISDLWLKPQSGPRTLSDPKEIDIDDHHAWCGEFRLTPVNAL